MGIATDDDGHETIDAVVVQKPAAKAIESNVVETTASDVDAEDAGSLFDAFALAFVACESQTEVEKVAEGVNAENSLTAHQKSTLLTIGRKRHADLKATKPPKIVGEVEAILTGSEDLPSMQAAFEKLEKDPDVSPGDVKRLGGLLNERASELQGEKS